MKLIKFQNAAPASEGNLSYAILYLFYHETTVLLVWTMYAVHFNALIPVSCAFTIYQLRDLPPVFPPPSRKVNFSKEEQSSIQAIPAQTYT